MGHISDTDYCVNRIIYVFASVMNQSESVSNTEYETMLENGEIVSATIEQNQEAPTGAVRFQTENGVTGRVNVSDVNEAQDDLREQGVTITVGSVSRDNIFFTLILPVLLVGLVVIIFMSMMNRSAGGGSSTNARMMNFGKSRAKMTTDQDKKVLFSDVAGLTEEKEDLVEIVDFLKNPQKYIRVGARIPKGVLLVGPPGTGKTLLAKAVAGEAGVPFFSISGSDFVEMFVGVGASRVRDLFEDAKKNAPCIIFIDEIDAVARRRGTGMGGGHDEREQTLNQLLVEMDGFGVNEGIIVMAATNRVDILDPAILRPGRFDRRVAVGVPDVRGREEILRVHAKGKPLGDDVDLKQIAQTTAGFTGAELENLLNEAAIHAAKANRVYLMQEDIKEAFIKVGVGTEKKSRVISTRRKKSPLIMRRAMRFCSMCFRIWSRFIRFQSFPPVPELPAIPCLSRRMTICLIPEARCCSTLLCAWAAVWRKRWYLTISRPERPRTSSVPQPRPEPW